MPRHSTSLDSFGGALLSGEGLRTREAPAVYGAGLRAREAPAIYAGGSKRSGGYGSAAGAVKNPWIRHVLAYQSKHGCSYKEAMTKSRASY